MKTSPLCGKAAESVFACYTALSVGTGVTVPPEGWWRDLPCPAVGWTSPCTSSSLLLDRFWEELRCYPHGGPRHREGTDSGEGVEPELRDLVAVPD